MKMATKKNVNTKDEDEMTPYGLTLSWMESVKSLEAHGMQNLKSKIEEVKRHFQKKGARDQDAIDDLKYIR